MPISGGGSGPGGSQYANSSIVPVSPRSALPPLNPSAPIRRPTTARPAARRASTRGTGASGTGIGAGDVGIVDDYTPVDQVNVFRRRSPRPGEDTISLSEWMNKRMDEMRARGLLRVWPKAWSEAFSWGAQSIKSFVTYRFGNDRPQYVDARTYGYSAGGGF